MILVSRLKTFTPVIRKYKGACDNAVLELVKPMLDNGHTWYFDTLYSFPVYMRKKNVYRTVKSIMKTMPTDLLKKKLKKGKADRSHQWHYCKDI
jgi:hypothetical protein